MIEEECIHSNLESFCSAVQFDIYLDCTNIKVYGSCHPSEKLHNGNVVISKDAAIRIARKIMETYGES